MYYSLLKSFWNKNFYMPKCVAKHMWNYLMGKKIRNYSYDYGVNFKWWDCKLQTEGKITWKVPVGKVPGG